MNTKPIILILILISLAFPVSAESIYRADIQINEWHNDSNVATGSWTPQDMTLFTNESNSLTFTDGTVKFIRGVSESTGFFTVTGVGIENPGVQLTEGADAKMMRDTQVNNNGTYISIKKIKIQLIDIRTISSTDFTPGTNTTSSSDNPVYAYVYYDRELPLAKGKVNNFNGEDYVKQTGWTTEGGVSEISVYFKRKDISIPMAISVKAESTEPKVAWTEKTAKYTIDSNGKYEFTIKYETKNVWGWKEEFTEVYTLITTGMSSSSSSGTKAITSEAPYEANVDSEFIVTMSTTGTFEKQTGVTVTDAGNRRYAFAFDKPGQYDVNFKGTDGGSAVVKFSVKSATASTTTTETEATTANQQQPQDGDGGSLIWYLVLLIATIGVGWMLISKKKKSASYHLHAKTQ